AEQPLPPQEIGFAKTAAGDGPQAPPRRVPELPSGPGPESRITDPQWLAFDFDELQLRLAGQRARAPRIRVPTAEEMNKQNPKAPPRKIGLKGSLVRTGYHPSPARGW